MFILTLHTLSETTGVSSTPPTVIIRLTLSTGQMGGAGVH